MKLLTRWVALVLGVVVLLFLYSSSPVKSGAWNSISAEERKILTRRMDEFDALSVEEQAKIRELHALVNADTDEGRRAKALLDRFGRWVDTLPVSDRARIQQSTTSSERLAVARQLVQQQSQYLAQAVEPFREAPRGQFRRPFRYDEKSAAEYLQLIPVLKRKISPEELKAMETLPRSQSIPLGLALAIKNDLPLPAAANELAPGIFEVVYRLVDDPVARFGAETYVMLDREGRKRFAQVMIDVLMLPELTDSQRRWLQSQPKSIRTGIQKLSKLSLYQRVIVSSLYFKEHPMEAPESTRETLLILDPAGAMERFAKLYSTEGRLPRPDKPPGDPPRGEP